MVNYRNKFIFIAGPCVIEDKTLTLDIAAALKDITAAHPVLFVFKASFDKANRTSLRSYRGPGLTKGIKILEAVKKRLNVPVVSDVHCVHQVKAAADVLDIIQIPAFLSRQTDLVVAAAATGKAINIKKAQFMAPWDINHVVKKAESAGNKKIILTERGSSFGYNNLVVDFRSLLIMKQTGCPVIFDATHSLQRPSASGGISGGDACFVEPLACAACACGIDGLFMEVHPRPRQALSDKHTTFPIKKVAALLKKINRVREAVV